MTTKHYDQVWSVKDESALGRPLRWRKPRRIFVNSTSDLFHESVPYEWIDRVFAVMARCPQHTFQILTKRPERARAYLNRFQPVVLPGSRVHAGINSWDKVAAQGAPCPSCVTRDGKQVAKRDPGSPVFHFRKWPLPNVWLGTSISDQASADLRIPHLLNTPAAVRFVSAEPLLGPLILDDMCDGWKFYGALRGNWWHDNEPPRIEHGKPRLDLVIVGGESGPGARVWDGFEGACRSLRDQCRNAGVAFFMKQMAGARKSAMPPIPDDLMIREFPNAR